MRYLFSMILLLISVNAVASNPEVLLYAYSSTLGEYEQERTKCINNSYDLETKAMDKTNDTAIRVRKSRLEYHPAGIIYCYAKFFASEKTTFKKNKQIFNMKKCNDKNQEIAASEMVVWTDFFNRVKLRDGSKGCIVYSIQGVFVN